MEVLMLARGADARRPARAGGNPWWRPAGWRRTLPPAAAALLALGACGRPGPVAAPFVVSVTLEGREVVWTSSAPSRGAVRYGRHSGAYDRVAYPPAEDRADLAYTTTHRIRLLSVAALDSVYLQVLDQRPTGEDVASGEFAFRLGAAPAPALLEWTMIDVGFGDSHLLAMPASGARVLVDAGERRDAENVRGFLAASGVTRLDAVVATHVHEDHIGGLVGEWGDANDGVLGTVEAELLLDTPDHAGTRAAYDELLALAAMRGVDRVVIAPGETDADQPALRWDPAVGVVVLRAGGGALLGGATESDRINDDSIVLRLTYGEVGILLGGDAESPAQYAMLASGLPLAASALKVHHHGAADASEPAYLAAADPRVGLFPIATEESFDGSLPSGAVVARLRARGMDLFASDRAEPLGIAPAAGVGWNVTVASDGASVEVRIARSSSVHYPPDAYAAGGPGGTR